MKKFKLVLKLTERLSNPTPNTSNTVNIQTFGQLKQILNNINRNKGLKKAGQVGVSGLKGVLDFAFPSLGLALNSLDFITKLVQAPDTVKTNTPLDKFNVDDYYSKIIDKGIEGQFITYLLEMINSKPDNEVIPHNWDANKALQDYLIQKFSGRTLAYRRQ